MPETALTPEQTRRAAALCAAGQMPTPQELLDGQTTLSERTYADTATGAALGGGYRLGDLSLKHCMAHNSLLHLIDSPLVAGGEDDAEITHMALAEAIYVLAEGRRVVQPVLDYQARLAACNAARSLAEKSPEHMSAYIAAVELATAKRQAFTMAALDFWQAHIPPGTGLQEVCDWIARLFRDAAEAAEALDAGEKKTAAAACSTSNGWRVWSAPWRALLRTFRAKSSCGNCQ